MAQSQSVPQLIPLFGKSILAGNPSFCAFPLLFPKPIASVTALRNRSEWFLWTLYQSHFANVKIQHNTTRPSHLQIPGGPKMACAAL